MRHLSAFTFFFFCFAFSLFSTGEQDSVLPSGELNYQEFDNRSFSIAGRLSDGLFTNEMDGAFSADESSSGVGFADIEDPYIFGCVDNPENLANSGFSNTFFLGAYIPGSVPFSFYGQMQHIGVQSQLREEMLPSGNSTKLYDISYFRKIDDDFQFLFNKGRVTTGLFYNLLLEDSRQPDENYQIRSVDPSERYVVKDMNQKLSSHKFILPLFLDFPGMQHYFELGFTYASVDSSLRNDLEKTDFSDISRYYIPELKYRFHLPTFSRLNERNQLSLTCSVQPAIVNTEQEGSISGDNQRKTSENQLNFNGSFRVNQSFYFSPDSIVSIAFKPELHGFFGARPLLPESSVGQWEWGARFSCASVVEVLPADWIAGFILGVVPSFGYSWEISMEGGSDPVRTYYTSDLDTEVTHSYSIFFPFRGGHRLDVSVGFDGLWDFSDMTMQLIVPLRSKRDL